MRHLLLLSLLLTACSKKEGDPAAVAASDESKHLAELCVEASAVLGQKTDDETYRKNMATVMSACAKACEQKQEKACTMLDKQVGALCKVSSEVCGKLCDPSHPGALTDAACKAQKAK